MQNKINFLNKKYEYLDHTADVIIKSYGRDFSEALSNSILALSNLFIDLEKLNLSNLIKSNSFIKKEISIKALSKESLYYDVLNEIIFIIDTDFISPFKVFDSNIEIINNGGKKYFKFNAQLYCIEIKKAKIKGSVKSATYNNMKIIEDKLCTIQTVVDL
jgi:SHS2 domain-containing protein